MKESNSKTKGESGVSLVELMVVCVIIGLVASIAFMSRGSANEVFQRMNGSGQLKQVFERARFDSVKRRADGLTVGGIIPRPFAQVTVQSDRFTLRTYNDTPGGGAPTPQDETVLLAPGIVAAHYTGLTLPMVVSYSRRGEPSIALPQFRICNNSCSSPTGANSDIVIVTPTGTVNLLPGNASLPTFTNPTLIGNPGAGDQVNDDVVIP